MLEKSSYRGAPYILVHQARFADPTVSKDNDLHRLADAETARVSSCSTLRRTFFLDAMVSGVNVCCREEIGCVLDQQAAQDRRICGSGIALDVPGYQNGGDGFVNKREVRRVQSGASFASAGVMVGEVSHPRLAARDVTSRSLAQPLAAHSFDQPDTTLPIHASPFFTPLPYQGSQVVFDTRLCAICDCSIFHR
jgi:hypothetical protein